MFARSYLIISPSHRLQDANTSFFVHAVTYRLPSRASTLDLYAYRLPPSPGVLQNGAQRAAILSSV